MLSIAKNAPMWSFYAETKKTLSVTEVSGKKTDREKDKWIWGYSSAAQPIVNIQLSGVFFGR